MDNYKLISATIAAMKNSYSPYSSYPVGAALLSKGGRIFLGTNIENASLGLTICAERVAMFSAIAEGVLPGEMRIMVVATKDGGMSCGACRQVMIEFNPNMLICFCSVENGKAISMVERLAFELLPEPFKL